MNPNQLRCILLDSDMKVIAFDKAKDSLEKQAEFLALTTKKVYLVCTVISKWGGREEESLPAATPPEINPPPS